MRDSINKITNKETKYNELKKVQSDILSYSILKCALACTVYYLSWSREIFTQASDGKRERKKERKTEKKRIFLRIETE